MLIVRLEEQITFIRVIDETVESTHKGELGMETFPQKGNKHSIQHHR